MADVRERVLLRAADVMESRAEEFLELLVREGGKAQSIARGEFVGSVNLFRVAAGRKCRRHTTEMYPGGQAGGRCLWLCVIRSASFWEYSRSTIR